MWRIFILIKYHLSISYYIAVKNNLRNSGLHLNSHLQVNTEMRKPQCYTIFSFFFCFLISIALLVYAEAEPEYEGCRKSLFPNDTRIGGKITQSWWKVLHVLLNLLLTTVRVTHADFLDHLHLQ